MFTYQTPTRRALLAAQKRAFSAIHSSLPQGLISQNLDHCCYFWSVPFFIFSYFFVIFFVSGTVLLCRLISVSAFECAVHISYPIIVFGVKLQDFDTIVWHQEEYQACKTRVKGCWRRYLSGVTCVWFAYGPADAIIPSAMIGPIPWGHSGPLCHALSLSWTSMRRRRATVAACDSSNTWWMAM